MCWSDAFVRYYTCGATTGQLSPLDLGPVGVAAASTKSPRICTNRRQAQAEFAAYNRRWKQLQDEYWQRAQLWSQRTGQPINHYREPRPAALKRFDVWLGASVPCPPQPRVYYGVLKYTRHCVLDPTGHIDACTQVHQPHKYPHAPGTIPVGWHSIHVCPHLALDWVELIFCSIPGTSEYRPDKGLITTATHFRFSVYLLGVSALNFDSAGVFGWFSIFVSSC
ncbi:hypothetical protein B0H16DRAFT_1452561 [Mycena metata]|uniref:Uncharacterized protein n=1 Tax=Mycena metata TaxID=1033252 RepID=A0AAD7JS56_9AGAR|nr:hypothetical protein B0H16DRAFT_1452561 [Mycena metata]